MQTILLDSTGIWEIKCRTRTMIAHHIVDMYEKLLDEIPQSAQVQAGVFLSVCAVSLAPSHCFVQPELHLLDIQQGLCHFLKLDLWLQLRHFAACGECSFRA